MPVVVGTTAYTPGKLYPRQGPQGTWYTKLGIEKAYTFLST